MPAEKFRYLQGVIAAHEDHTVHGRTRLQKTVRLLQRIGLPTDYDYTLFFYGPYSESVHFDLGLLKSMNAVEERRELQWDGNPVYHIEARDVKNAADVSGFAGAIQKLESRDSVVLELAATYDSYRQMGHAHDNALSRLHRKKGAKCTNDNVAGALKLLAELNLPAA
ncbi:MAG TPA: hypothetical protein VF593_10775 [Chthoniobacteraceae bacterium]|jgi:uncharacterized protein YwgA